MSTRTRRSLRLTMLGAALVAASMAVAPIAFAEEGPPIVIDEVQVDQNAAQGPIFTPTCFGEPATIVMTTPGQQDGTSGDDVIIGSSGDDFIDSLGGHDRICSRGGVDRITADYDNGWLPEIIVLGEGAPPDDDFIDGEDDGDVIMPGVGNDHVYGSGGSDYLYGQDGDDSIYGGSRQDWLDCYEGEDYADGGLGSNDWVNNDHGCETLISASPTGA